MASKKRFITSVWSGGCGITGEGVGGGGGGGGIRRPLNKGKLRARVGFSSDGPACLSASGLSSSWSAADVFLRLAAGVGDGGASGKSPSANEERMRASR